MNIESLESLISEVGMVLGWIFGPGFYERKKEPFATEKKEVSVYTTHAIIINQAWLFYAALHHGLLSLESLTCSHIV